LASIIESERQNLHNITLDGAPNSLSTRYQWDFIQHAFLYVVTETVFNYPYTFISEKSFKGITAKRPFIIVGTPNCIGLLQSFGFKTFSQWWDESYDQELDPTIRFKKLLNIIDYVNSLSINELKELCLDMQDVLDYNFQHYKTTFKTEQLTAFNQNIQYIKRNGN